ncbi:MAG: LPS export ABC transporter periplasmic protein LptC [Muribaculaceae bacterium]|nr:LPS export ABC transporter periplasmic protein LptC [Muribaculaceae bacterium]MDE6803722.1 LPS export ABC transporter periplasmic protein LptC [Muribaculaceae bacterium]MDE7188629.1 LPS export ABC transporter periplasmic protein LptC [Muribaculaceae bacterium]
MRLRGVRTMRLAGLAVPAMLILCVVAGCREESHIDVASSLHPSEMPSMMTRSISTLISDSGVTQYRIVAPLWLVYDEADTPYWSFPEGLYLEKYDRAFNVIATVAADSALFLKRQQIWRLDGNVEMTKVPGELFQSPQVFWDQRRHRIYNDTFIHIENPSHVIEGTGFDADERLTSYRILNPQGIFPVENPK